MNVHINDLPSDLSYFLEFLLFKQLFIIEAVCTKWKLCVNKTMNGKEAFNIELI